MVAHRFISIPISVSARGQSERDEAAFEWFVQLDIRIGSFTRFMKVAGALSDIKSLFEPIKTAVGAGSRRTPPICARACALRIALPLRRRTLTGKHRGLPSSCIDIANASFLEARE